MTDLLRILVSPLAWLASFSAIYGLQGLLCEIGPNGMFGLSWDRVILVAAFLLAVLMQLGLLALLNSARFPPNFTRTVSRTSGWVGLMATIWTLIPILAVSTCS
jgi:hypothetical protein